MRCGSWTKDLGHELDMYDLLRAAETETAWQLSLRCLAGRTNWNNLTKCCNLQGMPQVVATQHEQDWDRDAARQVYWPGQKLMMMMHSTAQSGHTRHAFALFIISCHGMGQHVWRVPKDQWSILAGSSLMTLLASHTRTASFICRYISGAQNAASSCGSQTCPHLPLCLLDKQLFLFCDLVGCALAAVAVAVSLMINERN